MPQTEAENQAEKLGQVKALATIREDVEKQLTDAVREAHQAGVSYRRLQVASGLAPETLRRRVKPELKLAQARSDGPPTTTQPDRPDTL